MAIDYSVTKLIADVKRNGSVPTSQSLYEDVDFCAAFDDCQTKRIVPAILSVREEFFVVEQDFATAVTETANRSSIELPERAIGERLRGLQLLDQAGVVLSDIPRLNPERQAENFFPDVMTFGYIFVGSKVVFPTALLQGGNKIRIRYFRRPNRIVDATRAGKVVSIDLGTGNVTLENVPAGMAVGSVVDFIKHKAPFSPLADDVSVIGQTGLAVQFSITNAAKLSVGDYICFSQETVVPQLPADVHPILVEYGLSQVLRSLGDDKGAAMIMSDLPKLEQNIFELLDARDDGSERKIIAPGSLWGRRGNRWLRRF
jgi:2-phospho-L-lactate guanylyltransferase (CobY/MobA/RfbA family)